MHLKWYLGEIWLVHKKAFFDESSHISRTWHWHDLTLIDKKYLKLGVTIIKYAHVPPHRYLIVLCTKIIFPNISFYGNLTIIFQILHQLYIAILRFCTIP